MGYKIELIPSGVAGAKPTMFRGGIKFEVGEAQVLDLNADELEVFKNDWRFKVSDTNDSGATLTQAKVAAGETVSQPVIDGTKEAVADTAEVVADKVVAQEEVANDKDKELFDLDVLLKDFSRGELNAQAKKFGIKKPEAFDNKTEVAQAIVDAQ